MKLLKVAKSLKLNSAKVISVDSLSDSAQTDLVQVLEDTVPQLSGQGESFVRENLLDLVDPPLLIVGETDPNELKARFPSTRRTSPKAVDNLVVKLNKGIVLDPVWIANDKFIDGGHRVEAHIKAGKKIPTADISAILNMDWDAWLAGEDIDFKSLVKV